MFLLNFNGQISMGRVNNFENPNREEKTETAQYTGTVFFLFCLLCFYGLSQKNILFSGEIITHRAKN